MSVFPTEGDWVFESPDESYDGDGYVVIKAAETNGLDMCVCAVTDFQDGSLEANGAILANSKRMWLAIQHFFSWYENGIYSQLPGSVVQELWASLPKFDRHRSEPEQSGGERGEQI